MVDFANITFVLIVVYIAHTFYVRIRVSFDEDSKLTVRFDFLSIFKAYRNQ